MLRGHVAYGTITPHFSLLVVCIESYLSFMQFGKIGTTGQTTLKSFSDDASAMAFVDKEVTAKVKEGM